MLESFLKEWWAVLGGVFVGIAGFKSGIERNRWRVDQLAQDVAELKATVKTLGDDRHSHETTLAIIQVSLTQIKEALQMLSDKMDGKADK